jgi:surface protein
MFSGASSFDRSLCWDLPAGATREGMFLNSPGSAQAFATSSLRTAVTAWCRNGSATAAATYGGIANWCTGGVEDMSELFYADGAYCGANSSRFNEDLSRWNTSRVTDMEKMFREASSFNGDVSSWDTSSVETMYMMFYVASSFNSDVSAWDVSSVVNMGYAFYYTLSFNSDVSSWDVSRVTSMNYMFLDSILFNCDLSSWDVSRVESMSYMFCLCVRLLQWKYFKLEC